MNWVINLPYEYNELEPYISSNTVNLHYNKHHKGYATKLAAALPTDDHLLSLQQIMIKYKNTSNEKILNNMNQIYAHNFFWQSMAPTNIQLKPKAIELKDRIMKYRNEIVAGASLFGSGYIWVCRNNNDIQVQALPNAQLPVNSPLLCIDIWEHAYYLDHQYDRVKFVEVVLLHIINWNEVANRWYN